MKTQSNLGFQKLNKEKKKRKKRRGKKEEKKGKKEEKKGKKEEKKEEKKEKEEITPFPSSSNTMNANLRRSSYVFKKIKPNSSLTLKFHI